MGGEFVSQGSVFVRVGNEDVRHFLSAIVLAILPLSLASLTPNFETEKLWAIFETRSKINS